MLILAVKEYNLEEQAKQFVDNHSEFTADEIADFIISLSPEIIVEDD